MQREVIGGIFARLAVYWRQAVVVLAGLVIYLPLFAGQWLWNDATVPAAFTFWEIWSRPETVHTPLASSVQWLLRQLVASSAFDFHMLAWLLQMAAVFLLWQALDRIGVKEAFLAALLFLVHPLTVESVAWIPDFANVLALVLMLGAFLLFLRSGKAAVALYLLAVLASDAMLMFPAVLVLYLRWKGGGSWSRDIKKVAPFLAAGLVLAVWLRSAGGGWETPKTWGMTVLTAIAGPIFLLGKVVWPFGLAPIYAGWFVPYLVLGLAFFLMAGVLMMSVRRWETWGRHVGFAMGFFLLMLLLPSSPQLGWVSNQQAYIPMIGLIALAASTVSLVRNRTVKVAVPAAVVVMLGFVSMNFANVFASERSLWTYALSRNPDAWIAHNRAAKIALEEERPLDALRHLSETVRLQPEMAELHYNYGQLLEQVGDYEAAAWEYGRAARLAQETPFYQVVQAKLLVRMSRAGEALAIYDSLLTGDPRNAEYICNRGVALYQLGRRAEAIRAFETALSLDPSLRDAAENLKLAIRNKAEPPKADLSPGRAPASVSDLDKPIQLFPSNGSRDSR